MLRDSTIDFYIFILGKKASYKVEGGEKNWVSSAAILFDMLNI
jgi:hypothetical protein